MRILQNTRNYLDIVQALWYSTSIDITLIGDNKMKQHCENTYCETEAVYEIPVSVDTPSDEVRSLCTTCFEAYTWGVQHGKKAGSTITE